MQMYEYEYLVVNANSEVIEINGKKIKSVKVWEVLSNRGKGGWEVVGLAAFGDYGWQRMILKRPLSEQ
jgi:hypothetical protein